MPGLIFHRQGSTLLECSSCPHLRAEEKKAKEYLQRLSYDSIDARQLYHFFLNSIHLLSTCLAKCTNEQGIFSHNFLLDGTHLSCRTLNLFVSFCSCMSICC